MESRTYYSQGKLMICGEYAVLKGATAFVLPTKAGQSLRVTEQVSSHPGIDWVSFDPSGNIWFQAVLSLPDLLITETTDHGIAIQLVRFLMNAKSLNKEFLKPNKYYRIETQLEFEPDEGLGSSSTLTANIAKWAEINPYQLHFASFKGSGFDVAAGMIGKPILYTMNGDHPMVEEVVWKKNFFDQLYFVHLNRKQISRQSIASSNIDLNQAQIGQISRISRLICANDDYFEFCLLLELIENEISLGLGRPTIKQELFQDFHGTVKSLGAWGGDYVLATGTDTIEYFKSKGYNRIIPFKEMISE
ncbi:MAG TPA: GYDIA family GHMP kinase [Bacteroidia bacterium]